MTCNLFFVLVQKVSYIRNHCLTQVTFCAHAFLWEPSSSVFCVAVWSGFRQSLRGCKEGSRFFLCVDVPGCPSTICSNKLLFPRLVVWSLIKARVQTCRLVSGLSALPRGSVCLCLRRGHTVFIIVLKLGSARPPSLLCFFNTVLAILCSLHFQMDFSIGLFISATKKKKEKEEAAEIWLWIALDL